MNEKIIKTLVEICEEHEEYTLIYTPAQGYISIVYTNDFNNEILHIEQIIDKEYKVETCDDAFTDTNIEFIISTIYNSLLSLELNSLIEDLDIDNVKDFNKIVEKISIIRTEYCN